MYRGCSLTGMRSVSRACAAQMCARTHIRMHIHTQAHTYARIVSRSVLPTATHKENIYCVQECDAYMSHCNALQQTREYLYPYVHTFTSKNNHIYSRMSIHNLCVHTPKHTCEHTSHTHIHVCKAAGEDNNKLVKRVAEMQQQIIFIFICSVPHRSPSIEIYQGSCPSDLFRCLTEFHAHAWICIHT